MTHTQLERAQAVTKQIGECEALQKELLDEDSKVGYYLPDDHGESRSLPEELQSVAKAAVLHALEQRYSSLKAEFAAL